MKENILTFPSIDFYQYKLLLKVVWFLDGKVETQFDKVDAQVIGKGFIMARIYAMKSMHLD